MPATPLSHWIGFHLVLILLLVVVFFALWSTSSTLMTATNQHQKMAVVYVIATAVTCAVCFFFAYWKGLYGAAASLLLSEFAMNFYVLPASLRIAHDTFPAFIASMFTFPASLKPAALLARLRSPKSPIPEDMEDPIG